MQYFRSLLVIDRTYQVNYKSKLLRVALLQVSKVKRAWPITVSPLDDQNKKKEKGERKEKQKRKQRNAKYETHFRNKKEWKKKISVDIIFVPVNGATSSCGCGKVVRWEFYLLFQ